MKTTTPKPMTKREAERLAAFLGNRRKQDEQSKAWSAALLRAARLIRQHYGLNFQKEENISAAINLAHRRRDERGKRFLAQLEAAE